MRKIIFYLFAFNMLILLQAQEKDKDKDSIQQIDEVVITAQYSKQSVKKSVYDVEVISAKKIEQAAANNLADLLNQSLNIQIIPDSQTGKSKVSLFGLDGQYFKVLIDGIPVVSDEGFGNNIDLTQINLDNVRQVEIVEGAMGVEYGANAVTGIINIITNTPKYGTNASITLQEETVGNEYEWWNRGRHIQKINLLHSFNDNWGAGLTFSRNDFRGFVGTRKGKYWLDTESGVRGYEWLPKQQFDINPSFHYTKGELKLIYKYGYFNELINYYNPTIVENTLQISNDSAMVLRTSRDINYRTKRHAHSLIVDLPLGNLNSNFSFAYQKQKRDKQEYVYDLYTRESESEPYKDYLNRTTYFLKNTYSNILQLENYNMQAGIELNSEAGYMDAEATQYGQSNAHMDIYNVDIFCSAEMQTAPKWFVRPGIRYSYQSYFKNPLSFSLSTKYSFSDQLNFRAVVGNSPRIPNYQELFELYVSPNHNIYGNENLLMERGLSTFGHTEYRFNITEDSNYKIKASIGYINLNDKISLAVLAYDPVLTYQYINLDKFLSWSAALDNTFRYKNVNLKFGLNLAFDKVRNETIETDYRSNLRANMALFYQPKTDLTLSLNYKYIGKQSEYQIDNDDTEDFYLSTIDPYHWMDISAKKSFFSNKIETTLGVRNIFNVKYLTGSGSNFNGNTHSETVGGLNFYGTSYFVALTYNIK